MRVSGFIVLLSILVVSHANADLVSFVRWRADVSKGINIDCSSQSSKRNQPYLRGIAVTHMISQSNSPETFITYKDERDFEGTFEIGSINPMSNKFEVDVVGVNGVIEMEKVKAHGLQFHLSSIELSVDGDLQYSGSLQQVSWKNRASALKCQIRFL